MLFESRKLELISDNDIVMYFDIPCIFVYDEIEINFPRSINSDENENYFLEDLYNFCYAHIDEVYATKNIENKSTGDGSFLVTMRKESFEKYSERYDKEWLLKYKVDTPNDKHKKIYVLKYSCSIGDYLKLKTNNILKVTVDETVERFHDGEIIGIKPKGWGDNDETNNFIRAINQINMHFLKMKFEGFPDDMLECMLPLCTKTAVFISGTEEEWKEYFKQKVDTPLKNEPIYLTFCTENTFGDKQNKEEIEIVDKYYDGGEPYGETRTYVTTTLKYMVMNDRLCDLEYGSNRPSRFHKIK